MRSVSYYLAGGAHGGGPLGGRLARIPKKQGIKTLDVWHRVGYLVAQSDTQKMLRAKMVSSIRRAFTKGYERIFLALNMQDPLDADPEVVRENLKVFRDNGWWDKVIAVEAADEPDWTRGQTKAHLAVVRGAMASLSSDYRSVGIMYKPEHFRKSAPVGEPFTLAPPSAGGPGPDFIGIEGYTDRLWKRGGVAAPWDMGNARNLAYVQETFKLAMVKIHPAMRLQVTFQAFDRNGAFLATDNKIHEESLVDLNLATWDLVRTAPWFSRVDYMRFFSWGRISRVDSKGNVVGRGTNYLPLLEKAHRKIIREAMV